MSLDYSMTAATAVKRLFERGLQSMGRKTRSKVQSASVACHLINLQYDCFGCDRKCRSRRLNLLGCEIFLDVLRVSVYFRLKWQGWGQIGAYIVFLTLQEQRTIYHEVPKHSICQYSFDITDSFWPESSYYSTSFHERPFFRPLSAIFTLC